MSSIRANPSSYRVSHAAKACSLGALLILSALAMSQALASPAMGWLGWIALLPLFLSIRVLRSWGAMAAGGVWGFSLFCFSMGAAQTLIAPTFASLVLLTVVPAAYAFFGARLTRRIGFSPLLLALGWVGVEFALGPLGLRFGILAGTQGDGLVLRAIGSFAGYVLVSFLVAYVNAALLSVLARVPARLVGGRLLRGFATDARRVVAGDQWLGVFHLIRRLQPRAPPALG